MSKKVLTISVVSVVMLTLFLTGNFPQFSGEEKCEVKSFRQLTESKKQICVKVGDAYKFVDVLTVEDIYSYTDFCLTLAAASNNHVKPNCGFFESVAMEILEYRFPRDSCIKYLRGYLFTFNNLLAEYPSRGEYFYKEWAKWNDENVYSSGCYSR